MIPIPYKLLGALLSAVALALSCYLYGRHAQHTVDDLQLTKERLVWAQAVQKGQDEVIKATQDNDALKTKLEVQHAESSKALNDLRSHPAGRVLLPTNCPASSDQADSASGSAVSATATQRAGDTSQAALDEAQRGMEADSIEWADALNACAVVMGWAKGQLLSNP